MSSPYGNATLPRLYDEADEHEPRLDPAMLAGSLDASWSYRGGTALMPAAVAPVPAPLHVQSPVGRVLAAHTPNRVQIRVSPPAVVRRPVAAGPTVVEWAVAVGAGLAAAVLIGVVAALV